MKNQSNLSIQVDCVEKYYGNVPAVKGISFDVARGEFVSLLGPSGCGKTTTLRMIAGFVMPSGGHIYINGDDMTRLAPEKRNVGFVFQNYALWPHMTVFENIVFGLKLRRKPATFIRARAEEVLTVTGLCGYERRFPRELSGGQQQRVALARALALEPALLLMDEPLSNLDRALRVTMRREIKQLQRRLNMTTLYVTHDQEEALSMSDRVVIMNGGEIVRIARPHEIYEDPQSEFVAGFVGNINIFDGMVARVDGVGCTVTCAPGLTLAVAGHAQIEKGATVRVLFRPERVRLVAPGDATALENRLNGSVSFIEYYGPIIRYTIDLAAGATVRVETHSAGQARAIGEDVTIAIRAQDIRLLDGRGAS